MKKLLLSSLLLTQSLFCDEKKPQYRFSGQKAVEHLEQTSECYQCDLTHQDLRAAIHAHKDKKTVNLAKSRLVEADLQGANLQEADLEDADLAWANLKLAFLAWANLQEANLQEANLEDANLTGADLYHTNLTDTNLAYAVITDKTILDMSKLTWYQWLFLNKIKQSIYKKEPWYLPRLFFIRQTLSILLTYK